MSDLHEELRPLLQQVVSDPGQQQLHGPVGGIVAPLRQGDRVPLHVSKQQLGAAAELHRQLHDVSGGRADYLKAGAGGGAGSEKWPVSPFL